MGRIVTKKFRAEGITCESCAELIREQALSVKGVKSASFDYASETGKVTFDSAKTDIQAIFSAIEEKGYSCSLAEDNEEYLAITIPGWLGWTILIIGILVAGYFLLRIADRLPFPQLSQNMGYGLLFLIGLLTGLHCIAMCGGFVVSYTMRDAQSGRASHRSHLAYGIGKTISYTVIGAGFGLLGSIIAFTPLMRGVAGLLAGLFLVLFGLKMLNLIPLLRKVQISIPRFIVRFVGTQSQKHSSPLIIGLLNGLMIACGPLQAIYVMAAGTGSVLEGARLLFFFGLGTLPAMLGFGYVTSLVSSRFTHKVLKASGVIVIILGLAMINNGLVLTGTGYDLRSLTGRSTAGSADGNVPVLTDGYQEIRMDVVRYGWEPDTFVLKKDVPVRWVINGEELNGCNNAVQVPQYGLEFDIQKGEQVIEFTPTKEGIVRWSCWMGMIPGTFIVKKDINLYDAEAIEEEISQVPQQPRGSCGGSCGGSGCGCGCGGR